MLVNELQLYECTVRGTTIQWKHIEYIVSYKRAETSDRDVGARAHCPLGALYTAYGSSTPFPPYTRTRTRTRRRTRVGSATGLYVVIAL